MESVQQSYGNSSKVISSDKPTEEELQYTKYLESILAASDVYEAEDEVQLRKEVLGELHRLVNRWVRRLCEERFSEEDGIDASSISAGIFTFGSYRLGVNFPGGDIDACCVVPKYIQRSDFFDSMVELLKSNPDVTELAPVPTAYVPIITMRYRGVPIDFMISRLNIPTVRDDLNILDNQLLLGVDSDKDILSLNGCRLVSEVLGLVPDQAAFRTVLRTIKLWGKRRGIHGNKYGYLGGVNYAIMTAFVCQCFPYATPAVLVAKFFWLFGGTWQWSSPVTLKDIDYGFQSNMPEDLRRKVYNPKENRSDARALMPILVPNFPSSNSMYNVHRSGFEILRKELMRGRLITEGKGDVALTVDGGQIVPVTPSEDASSANNNTNTVAAAENAVAESDHAVPLNEDVWKLLLKPIDFFADYLHYLQVIISASNEEYHRSWSGYILSQLRRFVSSVYEDRPNPLKYFREMRLSPEEHPWKLPDLPKHLQRMDADGKPIKWQATTVFIGFAVKAEYEKEMKIDIGGPVQNFSNDCRGSGAFVEGEMALDIVYATRKKLPAAIVGEHLAAAPSRRKSKKRALSHSAESQGSVKKAAA